MTNDKQETLTEVKISEYKGSPIISLPTGWGPGFSFGVKKAESILKYLKEIEDFVKENSKK